MLVSIVLLVTDYALPRAAISVVLSYSSHVFAVRKQAP